MSDLPPPAKPDLPPSADSIAPATAWRIVHRTYALLANNLRWVLPTAAVLSFPVVLLNVTANPLLTREESFEPFRLFLSERWGSWLLSFIVTVVVSGGSAIVSAILIRRALIVLTDGGRDALGMTRWFRIRLPDLLLAALLLGLVATVPYFLHPLAEVIGLFLFVRLLLTVPVMVVEGPSAPKALARSWALTRRRFWRLTGTLFLAILPIAPLLAGLLLLTRVTPMSGDFVIYWLLAVIGQALAAFLDSLLYVDACARREGLSEELLRGKLLPNA